MKGLLLGSVFSCLLTVAGAVSADDVVPYNPTNDPNGQTVSGMGLEKLSAQHCGSQKDVSQVLPVVQGEDTFDIQHRFLKLSETGMPEWVDLQLTGSYSWLKDTMYLNLDDASRTQLLNLIQFELEQLCQNDATLIPRSISFVRNEVKVSGSKKLSGVLQVRAMYVASTSKMVGLAIGHGLQYGTVNYTLQLKGGME